MLHLESPVSISTAATFRSYRTFGPRRVVAVFVAVVLTAAWQVFADQPRHGEEAPAQPLTEPQGDVGLGDALGAALVGNPSLASFALEVRIREALAVQAGVLPNPALVTEVENIGGANARRGWESSETTLSLAQLIEFGGKRGKRQRAAELERDVAGWEYAARRLDVVADTAKAFVATLAAQDRLALASELLDLAGHSVQTVAATVRTGAVSPVEETRARVALGRAQSERFRAERELAEARIALAATWGRPEARFQRVVGHLTTLAPPPPLQTLLPDVPRNPDVARFVTEEARRSALTDLERARRIPDVTVSAGGRHFADDGSEAAVFGFSVPLPIFDRNAGNILAAERALAKARTDRRGTEVIVEAAVRSAYEVLRTTYDQGTALRDHILPEARRTYEAAQDAYTRGLFRYLEVLDAQRTLFELRAQYLEALTRYHQTEADLARLTGKMSENNPGEPGRIER